MSGGEEDDAVSIISATTHNSGGTVSVYPLIQAERERHPKGLDVQTDSQGLDQEGSTSPVVPFHPDIVQVPLSTTMTRKDIHAGGNVDHDDVDDNCSEMSEVLIPLKQKKDIEFHRGGVLTCLSERQTFEDDISVEMSQSLLPSTHIVDLTEDRVIAEQFRHYQHTVSSSRSFMNKQNAIESALTKSDYTEQNKAAVKRTSDQSNSLNTKEGMEIKSAENNDNKFDVGTKDTKESQIDIKSLLEPEDINISSKKSSSSKKSRKIGKSESQMLKENTEDFFKWNTSTKSSQNLYGNEFGGFKKMVAGSQRSARGNGFIESQRRLVLSSTERQKTSNNMCYSSSQPGNTGQRATLPKTDLSTDRLDQRIGKLLTSIGTASEREQEVIKTTVEHCMVKLQDNLGKRLSDAKYHPHLMDHGQVKNLLRIIQSNLTRIMMLYKKLESENKQPDQPSLIGMHVQHKKNLLGIVQRQQELVKQFKSLEGSKNPKTDSSSLSSNSLRISMSKGKKVPIEGRKSQMKPTIFSSEQEGIDTKCISELNSNKDVRSDSKQDKEASLDKDKGDKFTGTRKVTSEKAMKRTAVDDSGSMTKRKRQELEKEMPLLKAEISFSDRDVMSDGSGIQLNEDVTRHGEGKKEVLYTAKVNTCFSSTGEKSREPKETAQSEMLWLNMLNTKEDKDGQPSKGQDQFKRNRNDKLLDYDKGNSTARSSIADVEDIIQNDLDDDYISESDSVDILTATKVNQAIKTFDECTQQTQATRQDEDLFSQTSPTKEEWVESQKDEVTHILKDVTLQDGKVSQSYTFEKEGNACSESASVSNQKTLHTESKGDHGIQLNDCTQLDKKSSQLLQCSQQSEVSYQKEEVSHPEEQVSPTSTCISSVFMVKTQELDRRQKIRMMGLSDGTVKGQTKATDQIPGKIESNHCTSDKTQNKENTFTSNMKEYAGNDQHLKSQMHQVLATQKHIEPKDDAKPSNISKPQTLTIKTQEKVNEGVKVQPVVKSSNFGKPQIIILNPQTKQNRYKSVLVVPKGSTYDSNNTHRVNEQKGLDQGTRSNRPLTSVAKGTTSLNLVNKNPPEIPNTNTLHSVRDLPSWRDLFAEKNILPGKNVLSVNVQGSVHRASLTENGKICDSRGIMFNTPAKWMSSLTSGQTVKKSKAFQQIYYGGKPITAYCNLTSGLTTTNNRNNQASHIGVKEKKVYLTTDQVTQTESTIHDGREKNKLFDEHLNRLLSTSVIKLLKKEDLVSGSDLPTNFWTEDYSQVKLCKSVWDSVTMW